MKRITVKSRIHRILKDLENFHEISDENTKMFSNIIQNDHEETLLGVYENLPNQIEDLILISDKGLYYKGKDFLVDVRYADLENVKTEENKDLCEHITLDFANNAAVTIPIRGRKGKLRDAFSFIQFLDRVRSDLKKG